MVIIPPEMAPKQGAVITAPENERYIKFSGPLRTVKAYCVVQYYRAVRMNITLVIAKTESMYDGLSMRFLIIVPIGKGCFSIIEKVL